MSIISLGGTCCIAHQLREYGLGDGYLPFDWVRINNFSNIIKLLASNFDSFFNKDDFIFIKKSNLFQVASGADSFIYKNKLCKFYHDFDKYIDKEIFETFQIKYTRRIERLYKKLTEETKITFIREVIGRLTVSKLEKFKKVIETINPDLEWSLVLICNSTNATKFRDLDFIRIYENSDKVIDWKRDNLEWDSIFEF